MPVGGCFDRIQDWKSVLELGVLPEPHRAASMKEEIMRLVAS